MGHVYKNGSYDRGYTKISNELINNPELTGKAKAILIYILSKPNDWETRTEDIVAHMKDGLDAIKGGLKELTNAGYLVRRRIQDKRGKFRGWETVAYESPMPKVENPTIGTESGKTDSGKSDNGKTHNRENRFRENPPLLITDLNKEKNLTNERENKGDRSLSGEGKNGASSSQSQEAINRNGSVEKPEGSQGGKNSAAPAAQKFANSSQSCDRSFQKFVWGHFNLPNSEFFDFLLKNHLPNSPGFQNVTVDKATVKKWLNKGKRDDERFEEIDIAWEAFLEHKEKAERSESLRSQPHPSTPTTEPLDPVAEAEARERGRQLVARNRNGTGA